MDNLVSITERRVTAWNPTFFKKVAEAVGETLTEKTATVEINGEQHELVPDGRFEDVMVAQMPFKDRCVTDASQLKGLFENPGVEQAEAQVREKLKDVMSSSSSPAEAARRIGDLEASVPVDIGLGEGWIVSPADRQGFEFAYQRTTFDPHPDREFAPRKNDLLGTAIYRAGNQAQFESSAVASKDAGGQRVEGYRDEIRQTVGVQYDPQTRDIVTRYEAMNVTRFE